MRRLRRDRCERAREWVSLRVDDELSELEVRMLDDHLAGCADCSDFASDVATQASALRAAPLVPFRAALALPRRRRVPTRSLQLAAAALAAAAVAAVGLTLSLSLSLSPSSPNRAQSGAPRIVPPRTPDDFVGVNIARRAKLIADTPHFWVGRRGYQIT
jgi:hypothetical protein